MRDEALPQASLDGAVDFARHHGAGRAGDGHRRRMEDVMTRRYTDEMIAAALAECGQNSMLAAAKLGCSRIWVWKFRHRRGDVLDLSTRRYIPRARKVPPEQFQAAL